MVYLAADSPTDIVSERVFIAQGKLENVMEFVLSGKVREKYYF